METFLASQLGEGCEWYQRVEARGAAEHFAVSRERVTVPGLRLFSEGSQMWEGFGASCIPPHWGPSVLGLP